MNKNQEQVTVNSKQKKGLTEQEIEDFRKKFIKLKENAQETLVFQKSRLHNEERMNEDERISNACLEAGIIDEVNRSINNATTMIKNCDNALLRIKNQTFGICYQTGSAIPKYQLEANPFLTRIANPIKK